MTTINNSRINSNLPAGATIKSKDKDSIPNKIQEVNNEDLKEDTESPSFVKDPLT